MANRPRGARALWKATRARADASEPARTKDAGSPLGEFEQFVLLALLRLENFSYGVPIQQELEERTGRTVSIGAVYKTLERLEAKGLVSSFMGDPTPERGGRRKKFYRLEAGGTAALKQAIAALRNLTRGLPAELEI